MDKKKVAKELLKIAKVLVGGGKEEYQKFFKKKLKEHGVSSPAELKGDAKKKFFNEIEKEWTKDKE